MGKEGMTKRKMPPQQQQPRSLPQPSGEANASGTAVTNLSVGRSKKMALLQTLLMLSLTLMQQRMLLGAQAATSGTSSSNPLETPPRREKHERPSDANAAFVESNGNSGRMDHDYDDNNDDDDWTVTEDSHEEQPSTNNNNLVERYQPHRSPFATGTTTTTTKPKPASHHGILVLTTVDGTMAGLSKETGEILWIQPGQVEAASTHQHHSMRASSSKTSSSTRKDADHQDGNYSNQDNEPFVLEPLLSTTTTVGSRSDWRTAAVPSMDGKVYLTAKQQQQQQQQHQQHGTTAAKAASEVAVTTTARELVERAPFVDSRGRVYSGSRQTTVLAVDARTGEIRQAVQASVPRQQERQAKPTDDPSNAQDEEEEHILWMGRVSYTVSIQEPRSGDLDVQFTSTELLSVHDMFLSSPQPWQGNPASALLQQQQQYLSAHAESRASGDDTTGRPSQEAASFVVATPSGHVAYWDQTQERLLWVADRPFETPVAFCLDADSGLAVTVDLVPDAAMPNGSLDYLSREMTRQLEWTSTSSKTSGQETMDVLQQEEEQTVIKSMSSGQLFAMPLGRRSNQASGRLASSSSSSTTTAHRQSVAAVAQTKPSSRVPQISGRSHHHHHGHFHEAPKTNKAASCVPGSLHFPGCLTDFADLTQRGSNFLHDEQDEQHAIVPSFHYGYLLPQQYQHEDDSRQQYERLLKILGSWLPPTIALIFVVSFELGRRKRQKDADVPNKIESDRMDTEQSNRKEQVGVIQVYDDTILGYGGHGTVVYKGMLEGRQVAVKRMLKAYHASADREISLLIESDGHPNVVRYFLKEVRGDFVYLALELCDLSLHDMIGTLRGEREQQEKENAAPSAVALATRTVLFQIASGVRHLHHLRIVHRDLKPANILLADSLKFKSKRRDDRSSYVKFMQGEYIAKISDMGLGKQLIGQSSYGASLLNEASLRGHSNGGQSSIVGAGPGSVGWQAPEVMALRAPSDMSVRSEGSQGLTESNTDSSPAENAANTRTSRSVDIFSLGCIFYSTLMPGCHPFGEWYEREANIMHNKPHIKPLEELSFDAFDLISAMLQRNPIARPTAKQICEHPFFWSAERRLAFLCDLSDRMETDATAIGPDATSLFTTKVMAIERNAGQVVGTSWALMLDSDLVSNVQRFRSYDPSSVRDLLRLIRNKHHHFDELPASFKASIGSNTDGLLNYFESKFPSLLIHCFRVCRDVFLSDDPLSLKYTITSVGRIGMKKLECSVSTITEVSTVPETPVQIETQTCYDNEDPAPCVEEPAVTNSASKATEMQDPYIPEDEDILEDEDTPEDEDAPGDENTPGGEDTPGDETPPVREESVETIDEIAAAPPVIAVVTNKDNIADGNAPLQMSEAIGPLVDEPFLSKTEAGDIVVWHASAAAKTFNCLGWSRSDEEWEGRTDGSPRKLDSSLVRCADDPKFRTRLCNHWDASMGTFCPMRKKGKCIFAHGPIELRVKEAKRNRWCKLVDQNGDNKNPKHSGGEDTYGAARSIESERKQEGKWNTGKPKGKKQPTPKKSTV